MVDVQVADKDVVDQSARHLQAENIFDASVAHVEEHAPRQGRAVAEFDHDARARLGQRRWPGRAAGESDAHFALCQRLTRRKKVPGS